MATVEHCLFCFEALAASLENRDPLSLAEIQASWAEYRDKGCALDNHEDLSKKLKQNPALERLAETPSSLSVSSSSPSTSSLSSLAPSASDAITPASSVNSSNPSLSSNRPSEKSRQDIAESPLFVTWNKKSSRSQEYNLRGCIGNFSDLPLSTALSEYALISAFQDTRFSPITRSELPLLSISVTLLTDFEEAENEMDWELGVHGIRISFYFNGRRYGSTYLPDVAVEQGWDKEETLISLMRKAGWSGREDQWRDVELKLTRYKGMKESLEHAEFKAWRDWVDGNMD